LFRVAPDGVLIDHVAEFAFEKKERARTLFFSDPQGYTDAVAKLVQTLACAEKILGASRPGVTTVTNVLKERLVAAGRLEYSEFFSEEERTACRENANAWLSANWYAIRRELEDPESEAESAMSGHLQREFYYYWLHQDPSFTAAWYTPEEARLTLPEGVLSRLVRPISALVVEHRVAVTDEQLRRWVEQNVTTHYRIFWEYWLHLGFKSGDEYMPAFTRSSLRFLRDPTRHSSAARLVMPFIGLAAVKKVKERGDLVERVVEWGERDGRGIMAGLRQLQDVVRGTQDEQERERLLGEVEGVLRSTLSKASWIGLNLIKIGSASVRGDTVDDTALSLSSRSYRWLWQIREPELTAQWRQRLEELVT
jgi:hypothetical protein